MKKKLFVSVLAVMLMLVSLCQTVFADFMDEVKQSPNAVVMLDVHNEDCRELKNLKDLKVHITCESVGLDISVPIEEVEPNNEGALRLGISSEKISDAIMDRLSEMQGELNLEDFIYDMNVEPPGFSVMEAASEAIDDVENILTDVHITVEGLPEGHYVVDSSAVILNRDICKQAIDLIMESARAEYGEIESFTELFGKMMESMGFDLEQILDTSEWTEEDWEFFEMMGFTRESIEDMQNLIKNIDPLIEYITGEEFSGVLIANAYLICECPNLYYYSVEHCYYERSKGKMKLVGIVFEGEESNAYLLQGEEGELVYAKDFKRLVYRGKDYKFLGSYSDDVLYDNYNWNDYKAEYIKLGENGYGGGLVLRYVHDQGDGAGGAANQGQNNEPAPDTGDDAPLGGYALVLAAAIGCMIGKIAHSR